jgi:hypothetical protein
VAVPAGAAAKAKTACELVTTAEISQVARAPAGPRPYARTPIGKLTVVRGTTGVIAQKLEVIAYCARQTSAASIKMLVVNGWQRSGIPKVDESRAERHW